MAIRSISRGLAAHGIETHVATTDDNGPSRLEVEWGRPIPEDGAVWWYFPRQIPFYLFSWPFAGWFWRHAADYDVIHIHTLFCWCSDVAALIARRKKIPYIIRPLGVLNRWGMEHRRPWLKRASFSLLERHLLRDAAFVHYTAEQERVEAVESGCGDNSMIIPNPVEFPDVSGSARKGQFLSRYPELHGKRIVLFLSRIDLKKGLDLLIPAFEGVRREFREAVLVIAGDGDANLMGKLRNQCLELGIENSVYWPGFLSGEAKLDALAEATVFVLPSYSENFGIAVIEAMAAGLPVVVTDQVGICREIAAGEAGIVTTTEVAPLKSAMLRVLGDDAYRASLAKNAVATAHSQFAAPIVIDKLIAAYRSVLGGNFGHSAETIRVSVG
ncbi:MAG TPA: glycosyltransferase [Bryobacteraceae bacterium]|nr:glycosyltransferase [Bryobacteraceae bacterium]